MNGTDHISQKVYYFPESYNLLRKELETYWPELWKVVGYPMAFDGPAFCEYMDAALDTVTIFDTANVEAICQKYLDLLHAKRPGWSVQTH